MTDRSETPFLGPNPRLSRSLEEQVPNVIVCSEAGCVFCAMAKSLLDRKHVGLNEVDVTHDPALQREMKAVSGALDRLLACPVESDAVRRIVA
ncbi:MAG: glutaredoxin family protein [Alphaproteobacteria bacterium]